MRLIAVAHPDLQIKGGRSSRPLDKGGGGGGGGGSKGGGGGGGGGGGLRI